MATKLALKPTTAPAGEAFQPLRNQKAATAARTAGQTVVRAANGAQFSEVNAAPAGTPLVGANNGETVTSGTAAINAVLATAGLAGMTSNNGQPLATAALDAINAEGIDPTQANSTTLTAIMQTWLPTQTAFQNRFPGIMQQIAAGQAPMSAVDYINLEDTMKGIATQYGLNPDVVAGSDQIAAMVTGNVSAPEMSARFNTYMDQYESEAPEVQQAFSQFYGINGTTAYAAAIANPTITDDQLKQQMSVASIAGAANSLGVNVGQSQATQLAQLGVTYQTALTAAAKTAAEKGLYTTSMGEQAQQTGPGAMQGLTQSEAFASNAKVATGAAQGSAVDADAVEQSEIENRKALFEGGGGASSTQAEGYLGLGEAQSS